MHREQQDLLDSPYLSVVVTARNDDHGGNLLHRMQIFVNALAAQAKRHNVNLELIFVEWNPPSDRPGLSEALQWPADPGPVRIRIITVSSELHAGYRYAQELPLYQMIAKNVGIRRAFGEFVLATNIDIIFSDELFAFLAERRLEKDKMYRIDRWDVESDVPLDAPIEEQLAYCRSHLLRLNAREASFRLSPEGRRLGDTPDVAAADAGIGFEAGWHAIERDGNKVYRWAADDARILLTPPEDRDRLWLDIEPGPGVAGRPFDLLVVDDHDRLVGKVRVERRCWIGIRANLSAGKETSFYFRAPAGGRKMEGETPDPRIMNFRVFSVVWDRDPAPEPEDPDLPEDPAEQEPIQVQERTLSGRLRKVVRAVVRRIQPKAEPEPESSPAQPESDAASPAEPSLPALVAELGVGEIAPPTPFRGPRDRHLHTNGCGDFTLLAREKWAMLRGYPEFDLFSMNIDSVFCYSAHYAGVTEEMLKDPMRIYHIEHATGSGFTPEGEKKLRARISAKGIGWLEYLRVIGWAQQMRTIGSTMVFNDGSWGLVEQDLCDQLVVPTKQVGDDAGRSLRSTLRSAASRMFEQERVDPSADSTDTSRDGAQQSLRSALRSAAARLVERRPLAPAPGWHFDAGRETADIWTRRRLKIWERCRELESPLEIEFPWHHGLRMALRMPNDLSRQLFVFGCIDPNELWLLDELLEPGMTFADVGAHEGLYTLFAWSRVGPEGKVWSFEPSRREFQALQKNLRLNSLSEEGSFPIGLSNSPGFAELQVAEEEHSGHNTLGGFAYPDVKRVDLENVELRSLDEMSAVRGLGRIDFIKSDVEGAELRVFGGAREVLQRDRPWLLLEMMERSLRNQGASVEKVLNLLDSLGYDLYVFDQETGLPRRGSVEELSGNVLGVPRERRLPKSIIGFKGSAFDFE